MNQQHPIILAVHMPKTGGNTFRNMLDNVYKEQLLRVEGKGVIASVPESIKNAVQIPSKGEPPFVIYGHYYLDPFHGAFPEAKLAVWLRDPVQRLLSFYFYRERSGKGHGYNPDELHQEENILKFAALEANRNIMSDIIGNHRITDFDFVGLTEEFDKSLDLFSAIFSTKKLVTHQNRFITKIFKLFKSDEVHVKSKNRNPDRKTKNYEVSDELGRAILNLNAQDHALFNEGKAHFEKLCKQWLP